MTIRRQSYTPLTNTDESINNSQDNNQGKGESSLVDQKASAATATHNNIHTTELDEPITVILLDGVQKRFEVSLDPSRDTLMTLREKGSEVHQVPPNRQRLIFMGRLLTEDQNDSTIKELNIEDGMVVHIFPKPRIVSLVNTQAKDFDGKSSTEHDGDNSIDQNNNTESSNNNSPAGAHVPSITIDPNAFDNTHGESGAVVQTVEIFESAQKVKMLAFILLVVSGMEILKLLTEAASSMNEDDNDDIPITDPGDPTDFNYDSNKQVQTTHEWGNWDYFDLFISFAGVYVSLLGLHATRENTLFLAKKHLVGVVVVGISWLVWDYYQNLEFERESNANNQDENNHMNNRDESQQALVALILPGTVWFTCFYRAWEFQHLLADAGSESSLRSLETENENAEQTAEIV